MGKKVNPMSEMKGIDVSIYQGNVDWERVKASGVQFAILRAGYGREISQVDDTFEANYAGCKAVGLPVGAYWYSYANSVDRAKQEAKTCLEAIKGKVFEFPVWFDQEYEASIKACSKATRTDMVRAFCAELESAGYYTGIYCSRDWLNNWLDYDRLRHLDVWVAAYGSSPGNVALSYGMWQHSSTGHVDGISGDVDLDVAYKNYPTVIRNAGLNGYGK